jgi:hypothetical protein
VKPATGDRHRCSRLGEMLSCSPAWPKRTQLSLKCRYPVSYLRIWTSWKKRGPNVDLKGV